MIPVPFLPVSPSTPRPASGARSAMSSLTAGSEVRVHRRRRTKWMRAVMLGIALSTFPLTGFLCDSAPDPLPGKVDGTERWVVYLKGAPADLSEFRAAAKKSPEAKATATAAARAAASEGHAAFASRLAEMGGEVVEHWWMTHAVTVQIPAGTSENLSQLEGVERIAPDVLLK